jgi:lincosamide nucleotidyltransferase A/C/D/E
VNLSAQAAADLYEALRDRGVRCWVMGGWGVDALVGSQTREHHDLDVLVLGDDLTALAEVFDDEGFLIQHVWEEENRWLDVDGTRWPTAFVAANSQGVELDVHLIELRGSAVRPLCNVPWPLEADSLEGRGVISGRPVDCVSARTQLAMHRGYELPEAHQCDVDQLTRLE